MLYAIFGTDVPNSLTKRQAARPAHLARITQLRDAGRLVLAGPHPAIDSENPGEAGFTGSLIVADFESIDAARNWINGDPYVTEGVFDIVTIKPFRQVLP